ncbi:MAG: hypothetical protein SFV51_28665, partial [Bryobacteraceae bacterium]|nr:hypothetical protein [Bryobacteraceae bacterium]
MKSTKTIAVGLLTFASTFSSHADEFSRWTWRNPKPLGSTLYSIIHAENQFVAVGAYGEIVTSTNGRTWTIEAAGTTGRFLGVCHGDGLFAAYGFVQNPQGSPAFLANLVVSPDARNWTRPPHNLPSGLQGMAYGASHWVCLDTFGNIRSSPDLAGWTLQVPAVISAFSELIFAQDKFVAVGNRGVIMTSTNGITWQEQDSGTTANLQDIAYGDGKFVVVGGDEMLGQGIILTSENAEDWWIQTTDFPLNGVAYGPNGFTAVGGGGFGTDCGSSMNSSDGVYFAAGPEGCDSGLTATPNDVACNDEVCVAVGFWGLLAVSEDGLIWSNNQEGTSAATLHATATTSA